MNKKLTTEQLDRINNIMLNLNAEDIRRTVSDLNIDELIALHTEATNLAAKQVKVANIAILGLAARRAADWAKAMEDQL